MSIWLCVSSFWLTYHAMKQPRRSTQVEDNLDFMTFPILVRNSLHGWHNMKGKVNDGRREILPTNALVSKCKGAYQSLRLHLWSQPQDISLACSLALCVSVPLPWTFSYASISIKLTKWRNKKREAGRAEKGKGARVLVEENLQSASGYGFRNRTSGY